MDLEALLRQPEGKRLEFKRDLTSLGCLTDHQRRSVPTAGGVLLFGRDRLACFPDAWMQAGSFAGVDRSQILDQVVLDGPLPDWVEQSIRFVDRHSARAAVIDGPRRRDVPALPAVAVREAIVNAVVHADYSQPGGPLRVALLPEFAGASYRPRRRSTWTIAACWTHSPTTGGGPRRNLPRRWAGRRGQPGAGWTRSSSSFGPRLAYCSSAISSHTGP